MSSKKTPGGRRQQGPEQPPGLAEVMKELCESPETPSVPRPVRARRAGPFKMPASIAGAGNRERESLARRFQHHLRSVSGANKLGSDPDETEPVIRPEQRREGRPGTVFRPGMPSRFGRPFPTDDED